MKNLYIHGSFMNDNYGDFLLYYVIENILKNYNKKYNWYSTDIDASYDQYCTVNRETRKNVIKKTDMAIFAGGGYFGEPAKNVIRWNIRCLYKHIIPAYKLYKKKIPYIIVGVEVGPVSLFLNRILLRKIFNDAKYISVRNIESKLFLEKIKVDKKIEVNPDWIMGIENDSFPIENVDINDAFNSSKKPQKNIFVHLTSGIDTLGMKNVVDDLIEYQSENKNIRYIIGCDQASSSQKEKVKEVYKYIGNPNNVYINYQSPWHLSKILKNVDAVITDKLHVGIVSTKYDKEVICVAKHPKSIKFYNSIGREKWAKLLKDVKRNDVKSKLNNVKYKKVDIDNKLFKLAKNNKKIVVNFLDNN